jgi:hypothetical protein
MLQQKVVRVHGQAFLLILVVALVNCCLTRAKYAPQSIEEDDRFKDEWYKYTRTVNVTTSYFKSVTGRVRVCNVEDDFTDGYGRPIVSEDVYCVENRIRKNTVRLTAGSWLPSTIVVWIASILLREQLHVPTVIETVGDGSHQFFPDSDSFFAAQTSTLTDVLNSRKYNWDGLNHSLYNMECSDAYRDTLSVPADLQGVAACYDGQGRATVKCKPCTHAMLDVWGGQEFEMEEAMTKRYAEDGGYLGIVARQGWFASKSTLDSVPMLSSVFGLNHSNMTRRYFQRPLPFGEFCYLHNTSTLFGRDEVSDALANATFACNIFYMQYPALDNHRCAYQGPDPPVPSDSPYNLCSMFFVTSADARLLAPKLVENERLKQQAIIFSGYLREEKVTTNHNDLGGTVLQSLCAPLSTTSSVGASWSPLDPHDLNFNISAFDVGSKMIEAWEMTNRLRQSNITESASLMFLSRPNPIFQRHKYNVSGFVPEMMDRREGVFPLGGVEWELERVELSPWNTSCEHDRQHALFASTNTCPVARSLQYGQNGSTPGYTGCDFMPQRVKKMFVETLKQHNHEAWYFLSQFQILNEDIEEIMGNMHYNPTYLAIDNVAIQRRMVVADWINKNRHRWIHWIPDSARTLRCLGASGDQLTLTGRYFAGTECSGHGVCRPDKWIEYVGVCQCDRGWTGRTTILHFPETQDDCAVLDAGDSINLQLSNPLVAGLRALCMVLIPSIGAGLLLVSIACHKFPMIHHSSVSHAVFLCVGVILLSTSFEFWIGEPSQTDCILRPAMGSIGMCLILSVNIAKLHFLLDTVSNVREFGEDIIVIENWAMVRDVFKMVFVPLTLGFLMYLVDPTPTYYRVEGKIWLKYLECDYHFAGEILNMFNAWYYLFLQGMSLVYICRLQLWKWTDHKYFLYIREDTFLQWLVLINTALCAFSWLLFTSNTSPNEESKLGAIATILAFFGTPSLGFMFLPKIMTSIVKPRWNSLKMIYKRKITPMELVESRIARLSSDITQVELMDRELRKILIRNEKKFEREQASLVNQVFLIKATLGRQIPTLEKLFLSLQLKKYQYAELLKSNKLNVQLLLQRKGNIQDLEIPVHMLPEHERLLAQSLFRLDRALQYNDNFIQPLPSTPRALERRPDSDEDCDEAGTKESEVDLDDTVKHLNLLDYDSAEEDGRMAGDFLLAPLATTTKHGFVERVEMRKRVNEAMDKLEKIYWNSPRSPVSGRRSPQLMIAANISKHAMARAFSREGKRQKMLHQDSPYKVKESSKFGKTDGLDIEQQPQTDVEADENVTTFGHDTIIPIDITNDERSETDHEYNQSGIGVAYDNDGQAYMYDASYVEQYGNEIHEGASKNKDDDQTGLV